MAQASHPRLAALVERARERAAAGGAPRVGIVYPGDALALDAAARVLDAGIATPVLIGPRDLIARAADAAKVDLQRFEIVDTADAPPEAALRAATLARSGDLHALMKGSLHTDELVSAVVNKATGLRGGTRISHAFLFDLPRYPKLLALADCVVNIAPDLKTKRDILTNAIGLLQALGIAQPKVAIVAAVETVNPLIPATLDAQALVELARGGAHARGRHRDAGADRVARADRARRGGGRGRSESLRDRCDVRRAGRGRAAGHRARAQRRFAGPDEGLAAHR